MFPIELKKNLGISKTANLGIDLEYQAIKPCSIDPPIMVQSNTMIFV